MDEWTGRNDEYGDTRSDGYKDYDELKGHLLYFLRAYNYGKQLKTLRGLTPYEFVIKVWQDEPSRFVTNPHHLSPGPYT